MSAGMAELYRGESGSPRQQMELRDRIHWLCAQCRGHRVLDVGCASATASILLAREGYEVVALDRDPEAIERAQRERGREQDAVAERMAFIVADATEPPADLGRFNTILIGHLLEYLVQPERVLAAAAGLLAEGGRLVVSVPFGLQEGPGIKRGFRLHQLMDLFHPAWRVQDPVIRHGGFRLVAFPRQGSGERAGDWQAPPELQRMADAAQRRIEGGLIEAAARVNGQLADHRQAVELRQKDMEAATQTLRAAEREHEEAEQLLDRRTRETAQLAERLDTLRSEQRDQQQRLQRTSAERELAGRRLPAVEKMLSKRREQADRLGSEALGEREDAVRVVPSRSAWNKKVEAEEAENRELRKLRHQMDRYLDRIDPSPGWPSSRLEGLIKKHEKLRRMHELVQDGVRRKIGDVFIRAARPSLDTLLLPARLISLFAEGRKKEQARKGRPALARGDRSGTKPTPAPARPAEEQGPPQPKPPGEVAPARPLLGWPEAEPGQRLCVYAEVNANLIDGSSIWLASLVETLAADPGLRLTVLLGQPIERPEVIGHLGDHPRIRWVTADDLARAGWLTDLAPRRRRLEPEQAVEALAALDRIAPQSLFIVREPGIFEGEHLLDSLVARESLAERSWVYLVDPAAYDRPERQRNLQRVAAACRRIVCQTPKAQQALAAKIPAAPEAVLVLPPMIPAVEAQPRQLRDADRPRLAYAGKLSPPYRILELLDAIERIRRQQAGAELHVIGDKIHNAPPLPGFEQQVRTRLRGTPGVVWHGGVSRARTIALLDQTDVASSWRDASFDDSLELSTKVLEYAALGLPVLLNPTPLQRGLFGDDYPGYVLAADDLVERFRQLTGEPEIYRRVSARVLAVARRYTFAEALAGLQSWLQRDMQAAAARIVSGTA